MKVLITGGTGLLGSRLARLLLDRGARVRIGYRPGDITRAVDGLELDHCPADLLDPVGIRKAVQGVEVVFHTAALVSFDPEAYQSQMRVNIGGTRLLLAEAARAGVRRFLYTSTVNTLGIPADGQLGDEQTPFDWSRFRLGYMDSKRDAERLVLQAARQGLDAVCLLPGTFFGPGDVHLNAGAYIRLISRVPVLVAPPGGTTAVHVDDVARGHLLALEKGRPAERYILGGVPISYFELFRMIGRLLGRPQPRWVLPRGPLVLLGRGASILRSASRLPVPLTEGLVVAACSPLYYSSAKAAQELGWTFGPLEEAIREAIEWYRRNAPGLICG
ncbi:MAG: NAD-dependent epimerase/dehydratase family protein [Bradymonadales bacterium]|nr:NAD-dependent epimerase/dehydratase family protein [Bradymonadales bacterium]